MSGNGREKTEGPLFAEIRNELERHPNSCMIHFSISEEPVDEDFDGKIYPIKWIAWNLCDSAGESITETHLDFIGPDHTKEEIEKDFADKFPNQKIFIDHDISFDDR